MKIAVCGKGGSGKSTICALLAKELAKKYRVLVLDIDESNYGLHSLLGMKEPVDFLNYFGGKQGFKAKQRVASRQSGISGLQGKPGVGPAGLFEKKWAFEDLPEAFVLEKGGVKLMAVGKIHEFGEGCACPMGSLARQLLENLKLGPRDVVLVDTEAGIEHFGRGLDKDFDLILAVVDPSYESLRLSKKIGAIAEEAGSRAYFVLNRVEDDIKEEMLASFEASRIAAILPENREIFRASLKGKELVVELQEIAKLADFLEQFQTL